MAVEVPQPPEFWLLQERKGIPDLDLNKFEHPIPEDES
jgi:hypothetical protein